jgi:hypothetical protein
MKNSFTNNRQPAYRRLSTRDSSRTADSPFTETESSASRTTPLNSQQPRELNLFESLIFNRQGVYEALSKVPFASRPQPTPTPALTPAPSTGTDQTRSVTRFTEATYHEALRKTSEERPRTSELDDTCTLQALHNPMAPVSKTPKALGTKRGAGRPRKTPVTKSTGKTTRDKSRKRSPPKLAASQVSKIQKTEANSKKKLDNSSLTRNIMSPDFASRSLSTGPEPREVIELIDLTTSDEEEDYNNNMELDDETEVDEPLMTAKERLQPKVEATQMAPTSIFQSSAVDENDWNFTGVHVGKLDSPDSDSDHLSARRKNSQEEQRRKDKEREQELQQLRDQLATAETKLAKATREVEELTKENADLKITAVRMENIKKNDIAKVEQRLKSAEEKVRSVIRERDQQGISLDNSNRDRSDLATKFEEQRRLREEEKKEHKRVVEDIIKMADAEKPTKDFLVTENARLRQEVERLKSVALSTKNRAPATPPSSYPPGSIFNTSSQPRATVSPAPSNSSSNDEEKKEENIRKTYLTVKKRFDNLHSAAVKIRTCTQSMDLSSFGEFGQYVRQLRKALEDDGKEARQAMATRVRDEDDAK